MTSNRLLITAFDKVSPVKAFQQHCPAPYSAGIRNSKVAAEPAQGYPGPGTCQTSTSPPVGQAISPVSTFQRTSATASGGRP